VREIVDMQLVINVAYKTDENEFAPFDLADHLKKVASQISHKDLLPGDKNTTVEEKSIEINQVVNNIVLPITAVTTT